MHKDCEGCPHCDFNLRTDDPVTITVGVAAADLVRGDGARHALVVTLATATTADPETLVRIGLVRGSLFQTFAAVSPQSPVKVLRYSDYGDALFLPISAISNVADIPVHAVSVRRVPRGY